MNEWLDLLPYLWLGLISLTACSVTVYDKIASKRLAQHRTPEKTLFLLAILGGSVAMYATMQLIRHKTQHKRFMIGIPLIMIAQIAGIVALIFLY